MANGTSGKIFTSFAVGDVLADEEQTISQTVWSDGSSRLSTFFTSSTQSASNAQYYYDVYDGDPAVTTNKVQFAVAYGDREGSGSTDLNANAGTAGLSPTKAIYSQYANILLNPGDTQFTLGSGASTDSIIVINFQRERIKQKLDPGNWEIWTSGSIGTSGDFVCFDNSSTTTVVNTANGGRKYDIVSGSIANGVYNSSSPTYVGLVYPDRGTLILDATVLSASFNINCALRDSDTIDDNQFTYLTAISRSATADSNHGMSARNSQKITSTFYFIRVKNQDYNYSNNSTFITGSEGQLRFPSMYKAPQVFITCIGLYNSGGELLAVAKLSKPLLKNFTNEVTCKVKLTY
jgi:hypothetical protein